MRNTLLYILLLFTSSLQAQESLTLQQAIETGLKNNYSIIIQKNEAAKAENNYTLGNAGMLPRLDAALVQTNSITDTRQEFATGSTVDRQGANANSLNASADLNWTIFDGFSMFATYKKLAEFKKAGDINSRLVIEDAVQQIIDAYYNIVKQQALLQVIDSSRKISDIKLNIAKTKFQIGAASRLPYLQAQVDRNADESLYKRQLVIINEAKIRLNQLLGRNADVDFTPADSITNTELNDLQQSVNDAQVNNAELQLAGSNLEVSRLTIREWRGQRLPFIDVNAGYDFTRSKSEAGIVAENKSNGISYGFTIGWNLFNGFNLNRNIKNAKLDYSSAEVRMNEIKTSITAQTRVAWLQLQSTIDIVNLEIQSVTLAKENIDLSIERFRTGLTDELQYKEAQQSYIEAANRLVAAKYDASIAATTLKRITGQLLRK